MDLQERRALVATRFSETYQGAPTTWVRAPGRVDLMGSHTDYNLGYVMTMTIDRDTWLALRPRKDRRLRVHSLNLPGAADFSLDNIAHDEQWPWTNYVRGMGWALQEAGYLLHGFDAIIHSTIPFGSGLSSSAALEMAVGHAFQVASAFTIDPVTLARLSQRAENIFVGVNSGILDQYTSAMGQPRTALLLDCRNLTSRAISLAPGLQVVICDTRAERNLVGTEYGERRAQCELGVRLLQLHYPTITSLRDVTPDMLWAHMPELPPVIGRRCRFIVEENQRVCAMADALPLGDLPALRQLMLASYLGARDLYEIGAPSLATMVQAVEDAPGTIAVRQAGAGFGGCAVALVDASNLDACIRAVAARYTAQTGIMPQIYPVWPATAAGILIG